MLQQVKKKFHYILFIIILSFKNNSKSSWPSRAFSKCLKYGVWNHHLQFEIIRILKTSHEKKRISLRCATCRFFRVIRVTHFWRWFCFGRNSTHQTPKGTGILEPDTEGTAGKRAALATFCQRQKS